MFLLYIYFFNFLGATKLRRAQKIYRELPSNAPRGYRPDSDFTDILLNRHYLMKQSGLDK